MPRRRTPAPKINGAGDPAILQLLGTNFRLWAALPLTVTVLLAGQKDGSEQPILAAVERPTFPAGVCKTCGCTETDLCFYPSRSVHAGSSCGWSNTSRTQCTLCAALSPFGDDPDHDLTPRPLPPAPPPTSRKTRATARVARRKL